MYGPIEASTADHDILGVEAGDIGYAMLLARHAAAEPVTDDMVLRVSLRTAKTKSSSSDKVDSIGKPASPVSDPSARLPHTAIARLFRARR